MAITRVETLALFLEAKQLLGESETKLWPRVLDKHVDFFKRLAVKLTAEHLQKTHGLFLFPVWWFNQPDQKDLEIWAQEEEYPYDHFLYSKEVSGLCDYKERLVWINSTLTPQECVFVLAHEAGHCAGDRNEHFCDWLGELVLREMTPQLKFIFERHSK